MTAERLLASVLAIPSTALATNFYLRDSDAAADFSTSAAERRDRLLVHLKRVADGDLVVVGEAPGWRGARQSGVPFTSAGTVGLEGSSEGSATVVHDVLGSLGITDRVLLWNAFPLHPHRAGSPRTNRTPTASELAVGIEPLRIATADRRIICVGNSARASVEGLLGLAVFGVDEASPSSQAVAVRHPANGGTKEFRRGVAAVATLWAL